MIERIKNKTKKIKKQAGFTLIEVIVASVILVVASIPIIGTFVISANMNSLGRQKEQAMTVAENLMEGIKAVGPQTAYKWAEGNCAASGYTVIPANDSGKTAMTADTTTEGYGKSGTETEVDLTSYELGVAKKLVNKKVNITPTNYKFKVKNIFMGNSYYDAEITITQDITDKDFVAAYAYQTQFGSVNMNIMKYYSIQINVSNSKNTSDVLAKYSGTVISKD